LGYVSQVLAMAKASAGRLASVLGSPPLRATGSAVAVDASAPLLELSAVRHKSLAGVSLTVRPGELVGVLCYDPRDADALLAVVSGRAPEHEGRVAVGGLAMEELDIDLLRRSVLVEQHDTDLFEGTLRSNLLAGSQADEGRLREVVVAAAATDVIDAHADGLDHPLTDRGRTLSGGQRQRLGLARALLAEPPVLVLHDPSTAVDAVTEEVLAEGLVEARAVSSLGTLVLTSSPALLGKMHRVVVLADGVVVAVGSHAELASRDSAYAEAVLR
jgi:putative ABC transport system ATP-binding protein